MLALILAVGAQPSRAAGLKPGEIVFCSNASGQWDLFALDPQFREMRQLTDSPETERFPAVSPGGRRLAYVGDKKQIWILDTYTGARENVLLPRGTYAQPAWSWDGKEMAYVEFKALPADSSEIFRTRWMEGRWEAPDRVSAFPPMRTYPAYSPDGKKIACAEFHRDNVWGVIEEIGFMDLDAKVFKPLTQDNADSFGPAWSPDGGRIAYTSNLGGDFDVWVIHVASKEKHRVTDSPAYDGEPSWSPDGREIVFASVRTGRKEIWAAGAEGGMERQLTDMKQTCSNPFWVK